MSLCFYLVLFGVFMLVTVNTYVYVSNWFFLCLLLWTGPFCILMLKLLIRTSMFLTGPFYVFMLLTRNLVCLYASDWSFTRLCDSNLIFYVVMLNLEMFMFLTCRFYVFMLDKIVLNENHETLFNQKQANASMIYHSIVKMKYIWVSGRHPWYSGSPMHCWPTGRTIDPAPGVWS